MTESKIELTHRLQREGRWDAASLWKDQRIAELRSEGKTRKEAQKEAWEAMAMEFPPIPDFQAEVADPAGHELEASDFTRREQSNEVDFGQDAEWVYQHLPLSNLRPEDAPSSGALGLLQWAKRNQNRFFEHVMPKAASASKRSSTLGSDELPPEYMDDLTQVKQMLKDAQRGWEEAAVADTHQAIKNKVASLTSDWERRFQLELPSEAIESWMLQMTELCDQVVQVAMKNPDECRNPCKITGM